MTSSFLSIGHPPTLVAALLYFGFSSAVWVLLGPLAPFLRDELGLTATQQGFLTAIPLLTGSLARPAVGLLADRIGGRRTGLLGLLFTFVPLAIGWQWASTPMHFYAVGLLLGVAGASFAVALPLAGRWYPREYQGLALGIVGAGNAGTLVAALVAPRVAERLGVGAAFGAAMLPLALVLVAFAFLAKDSPRRALPASMADYVSSMREPDTLWFSFFYALTFGGFIGFASVLTTFFNEAYAVSRVSAGGFASLSIVAGSLLRPVGGWLADRIGGYRLLVVLLGGFALCIGVVALMPALWMAVAALAIGIGMLGMGNGAVFQLVPQRFPERIGVVTGLVGTAGGLGGFVLPIALGAAKDMTGSYVAGLLGCGAVFLAGMLALLERGTVWRGDWPADVVERAGVYSYRADRAAAGEEAA